MGYFTDSPFERMMNQRPEAGQRPALAEALPDNHPCSGCAYGRSQPCVGVCMKDVMSRHDDGRKERA